MQVIDISLMCRDAPTRAIALNCGMWGDIADVITHAKFCVNWFRSFAVLTPPIVPFSTGLAGRDNSVSTTMLHCDGLEQDWTLIWFNIISYQQW